jgi:hypothetical protein
VAKGGPVADQDDNPEDQGDDETSQVEEESSPSFHFALPSAPHAFSAHPQKIILIATVSTGLVSLIEHTAGEKNPTAAAAKQATVASIMVGTFMSGALLLGLSYFLPEFAGGLAIVMLVTTVFERGKPFWDVVSQVLGGNPNQPSTLGAYTNLAGGAGGPGSTSTSSSSSSGQQNPPPTVGSPGRLGAN